MARATRHKSSNTATLGLGLVLLAAAVGLALWLTPAGGSKDARQAVRPTSAGEGPDGRSVDEPRRLKARVLEVFPHDPKAWTQGLLWHNGWLYESTGLRGQSTLRRVRLEDGSVELQVALEDRLFGEGLARIGAGLYQLTWQSGVGLRYELDGLSALEPFGYTGQGWGLCFDGRSLIRSDGSETLFFHEPRTFEVVRTVAVRSGGRPVSALNELECAEGWVYANVLGTDVILRVEPVTGRVDAVIDASGLLSADERAEADVLNGIAYYPPNGSFLLTGKFWPKLFEVVFVEVPASG